MRQKFSLLTLAFIFSVFFTQEIEARSNLFDLDPSLAPFYHSVASGDPLTDRVIIWTRVTPGDNDPAMITVDWEVALDTNFTQVINSGTTTTDASIDYTVNVDATGLQPGTWYYFRFKALDRYSAIGRTRTAPDADADQIRVAVVSCSNYQAGYFTAYERLSVRNDIDIVIHLGDYIYEYQTGGYGHFSSDRDHDPDHEIVTLEDYRIRHSHYRLDPDLQLAHQQYPWIVVWDDHESADDSWVGGAENHDESTQGDWLLRKNNSIQAYYEWLPMRRPDQTDFKRIWRTISFGNLVDFVMIDTRLYGRDEQASLGSSDVDDPNRTLLGEDQYDWLIDELTGSTAQWRVIGQQVMMAPLKVFGFTVNTDQWDGYTAERANLYNDILTNNVDNVVVLTGDIHTSWANNLLDDNGNNVAVEVVTTSITSPGFPFSVPLSILQSQNPHVQWAEITQRGYTVLDIQEDKVQADWYHVPNVQEKIYEDNLAASWLVNDTERFYTQAQGAETQITANPPMAPEYKGTPVSVEEMNEPLTILGTYPNPFEDKFILQYYFFEPTNANLSIYDLSGRTIVSKQLAYDGGYYLTEVNMYEQPAGNYLLVIETDKKTYQRQLIKAR